MVACSQDQCEQQPDSIFCAGADDEAGGTAEDTTDTGDTGGTDETGGPGGASCVPLDPGDESVTYQYACQGTGNGWVVLDIVDTVEGALPPACVNWGPEGKPDDHEPTSADCFPLDLAMLPLDVPSPGACCTDTALPESVADQCAEDCGYAACKLAIAKLREAAYALPEDGVDLVTKKAQERARGDLFGLADMLELPENLETCAGIVKDGNGEPVPVPLGAGMSPDGLLGHINDATLFLQCTLDAEEPFVLQEGYECAYTPNIPLVEDESGMGGVAEAGAVTMLGPDSSESADLSNIEFGFREAYLRDGSVVFYLASFEADAEDAGYGSLMFVDPHIHLAKPVSAPLVSDTVTFPAGSLRMEVSGIVVSGGEVLFGGERSSGVYVNTGPATVARTADGFAFVDAPFEAGGYLFVLNTEEGPALAQ
jgi:hypothetical protein